MTLDEAALHWGRAVLKNGLRDSGIIVDANSIEWMCWRYVSLANHYSRDEDPLDRDAYLNLACVMYAQDVEEVRHCD